MIQRIRTADLERLQAAATGRPQARFDAVESAVEAVNRAERNAYDALASLRHRLDRLEESLNANEAVSGVAVLQTDPVLLEKAVAGREQAYLTLRLLVGPEALASLRELRLGGAQ